VVHLGIQFSFVERNRLNARVCAAIPRMLEALTPAGRTGTPDDIAGVVAMLVRDEADFLNGACIPVSGGLNHPASFRRLQQ
jgi:3-oxoacyl-[acyl-carrier protein] reductase